MDFRSVKIILLTFFRKWGSGVSVTFISVTIISHNINNNTGWNTGSFSFPLTLGCWSPDHVPLWLNMKRNPDQCHRPPLLVNSYIPAHCVVTVLVISRKIPRNRTKDNYTTATYPIYPFSILLSFFLSVFLLLWLLLGPGLGAFFAVGQISYSTWMDTTGAGSSGQQRGRFAACGDYVEIPRSIDFR